jgi:hypothetical protein
MKEALVAGASRERCDATRMRLIQRKTRSLNHA